MNIQQLKKISERPRLHDKGTSVMWTDPYISQKLLDLHINPDIDIASRNRIDIENTISWILRQLNNKSNLQILDLGCGPGLYSEILAQKGHSVTGIDFSENSIKYAIKQSKINNLSIEYLNMNYLDIEFENKFDLIILIYLDFCVLLPEERDLLLEKIFKALKKGGIFICDVINSSNLEQKILKANWDIQYEGFWKKSPYIELSKGYHFPENKVLANQHIIIDEKDNISTYIFWSHYFEKEDILDIFSEKGFLNIKDYLNIIPYKNCWTGNNITFYTAQKE